MDQLIHINTSRNGHDKLVRLAQYSCKLIANWKKDPSWILQLEATLRLSRKLLRFGTCIDSLYASAKAVGEQRDPVLRFLRGLSKVANSMYLFADHLLVLHTSKLLDIDSASWSKTSSKCWLYSIVLQLVGDLYEINKLIENQVHNKTCRDIPVLSFQGVVEAYDPVFSFLLQEHKPLLRSLLTNLFNIFIPLATLGYITNKSLVAVCGVTSSYLYLIPLLNKQIR